MALQAESVESLASLGRMTAEDVIAPLNLFAFDHLAMDVYAVRLTYCNRIEPLTISDKRY
jgi:molybdopterin biosynthesis enzyme